VIEILPNGHASVIVLLSGDTRSRLAALTAENVGRRLAILVDGVAHSMPLIRERVDVEALPVGFYSDADFAAEVADRLAASIADRR
jgi:preprotein translocase subunit SecD